MSFSCRLQDSLGEGFFSFQLIQDYSGDVAFVGKRWALAILTLTICFNPHLPTFCPAGPYLHTLPRELEVAALTDDLPPQTRVLYMVIYTDSGQLGGASVWTWYCVVFTCVQVTLQKIQDDHLVTYALYGTCVKMHFTTENDKKSTPRKPCITNLEKGRACN